jgi:putative chitinase
MITAEQLHNFCLQADPAIVAGIAKTAPDVFERYGVTTALRLQHVMAQIAYESAGLTAVEENLNYSAMRLVEVWPSRFQTMTQAMPYAHNPHKLANKVYGKRMGNSGPDDGWLYRGQGLIQTTGRDNYSALARFLRTSIEEVQRMLASPDHALECAVAQLARMGIFRFADRDDIINVTRLIRGTAATTESDKKDLSSRILYLTRAKRMFPHA